MELLPQKSFADIPKKRSSKQKEREKKKLQKLCDKKAKQGKMREILASLQGHKNDIEESDYAKLLSVRTLGGKSPNVQRKESLSKNE